MGRMPGVNPNGLVWPYCRSPTDFALVCWTVVFVTTDKNVVIAILPFGCVSVKIPQRSFLLDITLIGLSVFGCVCSALPTKTIWVARWHSTDGRANEFKIDADSSNPEKIRNRVIEQIIRPTPDQVGRVRWLMETSEFYARSTLSDDAISTVTTSVQNDAFQTVAFGSPTQKFATTETSQSVTPSDQAARWSQFWGDRAARSCIWLSDHERATAHQIERLRQTIRIVRVSAWFPNRSGAALALAVALLVMSIGALWRLWMPQRQWPAPGAAIRSRATESVEEDGPTTAAMAFRNDWVRLRQPLGVHVRAISGCGIVLTAVIVAVLKWSAIGLFG